ncbi:putative N6-adenine methyltransferase-domain-containing protein [Ochromonadaceae sp. CCMP2298]|nr:putative N6-adenine methyltransferase-domain-containing protein [Ochromonadaceae sp. CCMP2298]
MSGAKFLAENEENGDHNQYWYSTFTIDRMVEDCVNLKGRIGFLSVPSIYFALPDDVRAEAFCFDFDKKWESDRGFVFYDFNDLQTLPAELHGTFDVLVVDPPFIVHEVWEKYAAAVKLLLKPEGKLILTTVIENAEMLHKHMGVTPTAFQPSIPNLVYQYNLFTNYESTVFCKRNPEIPE